MPQPTYGNTGGFRTFVVYSGAVGPDLLVVSGAGRLNQLIPHTTALSGQAVICYDSAVAVSGGPIALSGHIPLGSIPASPPAGTSGTFQPAAPVVLNTPFFSGLVLTRASGQVGVTVCWTPERIVTN